MANPVAVAIPSRVATASAAFAFVAATTTEQSIPWPSGGILIGFNSDASDHHVTVHNIPKSSRNTTDITSEVIAAGAYRVFPRFPPQQGGVLKVTGDDATITFAVIKP